MEENTYKRPVTVQLMGSITVEAICVDKTRAKTLATGLTRLKEDKIIDAKLFEWGDALRKERNIGAHAGDEIIPERDANDVLEFAIAISEYVYVLDEKYREFKKRKEVKKRTKLKRRKKST